MSDTFDVCMERIVENDPVDGMPFETYWQGSAPKTDSAFDDQIRSARCGIPEFGPQIAYPTLCYDHLTVTRH